MDPGVRSTSVAFFAVALLACPDVRRPASRDFAASGSVWAGGVERRGEPLVGAVVRAWPRGAASDSAEATADDAGMWQLSLPLQSGEVVLEVAHHGWVPASRALSVQPYTEVQVNLALAPAEELDCSSGPCGIDSDGLRVEAPPEGAFGAARAFDPQQGDLDVAGLDAVRALAAAWVNLDAGAFDADAGGFASDAGSAGLPDLALRIPFAAWPRLDDLRAGTGRLELPVRALDRATATWSEAGEAVLVSEAGHPLPESALAALRAGTWSGGAVARFALPRSGFWAVGWPAASPGCVEGTATVEGAPASGVVLELPPRAAAASGDEGAFCAPAPVAAGGDQGAVRLQYAGVSYEPATVALPSQPGACGSGACRQVGKVALAAAGTLSAEACRVSGTVRDAAGAPLPGAVVTGLDPSVSRGVFTTLCGKLGTRCPLAVAADEGAQFELVLPVQRGVQLASRALVENPGGLDGVREGGLALDGCPTGPVELLLKSGRDQLAVSLSLTGSTLAWSPARPAAEVRGLAADGGVKWHLVSSAGVQPPLAWGQVPAGASQRVPAAGSPAPLSSADTVEVLLIGTDARGYQFSGGAAVEVP